MTLMDKEFFMDLNKMMDKFHNATIFEVNQITEIAIMNGFSNREKLEILYADYDYHNHCMEYLEEMIELLKIDGV